MLVSEQWANKRHQKYTITPIEATFKHDGGRVDISKLQQNDRTIKFINASRGGWIYYNAIVTLKGFIISKHWKDTNEATSDVV